MKDLFERYFLTEMPSKLGPINNNIEWFTQTINHYCDFYPKKQIGDFCWCAGEDLIYAWYESSGTIELACEFGKYNNSLKVHFVSKKSNSKHYASDLYQDVLEKLNVDKIISDKQQTDAGRKIWVKLFQTGYQVGIMSNNKFHIVKNHFEILSNNHSDSVFVVSKKPNTLVELWCLTETHNMKKLNGWT